MPTLRKYIRHKFGGGWATDFGPTTDAVPDGAGVLSFPWLNTANDLVYELDGGPHKVPGTGHLNSSALESGATITGITDYWRQGTSGTPVQKRVIHIGTKAYKDDADGTFTEIASGLTDGAVPNYAQFDDFLIIGSDGDVPKSWDQTTFQNLAGSPPNFAFSTKHKNFHFAAGVDANPSILYWSVQLDPEDWAGGGSGNIAIDPDDGDRITGIISWKNDLWVFKGPYKGSIHRITGTSGSDFAHQLFIDGVGAVWQNSIFGFSDDIGFLWADGTIRTLKATSAFGDFNEATMTFPINNHLASIVTFASLRGAWAVNDESQGKILITLPINGSSTNNFILCMDYRFNPVRLSGWPSFAAASLSRVLDAADNDRSIIMMGGYDGFVDKLWRANRILADGTALSMDVITPFVHYGFPQIKKTLAAGALGIAPHSDGNFTFGWTRDNNAQQTTTESQGGTDVLAPADANQFTLGTSTLAGSQFVDKWFETEEGGEFRSIQYQITDAVANQDLELHSISAFIEPGAESTEN